jgi:hypothetical protein
MHLLDKEISQRYLAWLRVDGTMAGNLPGRRTHWTKRLSRRCPPNDEVTHH